MSTLAIKRTAQKDNLRGTAVPSVTTTVPDAIPSIKAKVMFGVGAPSHHQPSEEAFKPDCLSDDICLCAPVRENTYAQITIHDDVSIESSVHVIPPRRTIIHSKEWSEFVTIVCKGWAACSSALPDGRRQIHSILLPGDLVLSTGPFGPAFGHTVEAITEVTCRRFRRDELEPLILQNPGLLKNIMNIWGEARAQASQLALSLGRRTARERIASFLLMLCEALTRRGMVTDDTIPFPLRLKHIADATGLTPVHVSKVHAEFQRCGLIEIRERSLRVLNKIELRHIAGPQ